MKHRCLRDVSEGNTSFYEKTAAARSTEGLQGALKPEKYGDTWNAHNSKAWRQVVRRELRKRDLGT